MQDSISSPMPGAAPIRRPGLNLATLLLIFAFLFSVAAPEAEAAKKVKPPKVNSGQINLIPTITSINLVGGQLLASGYVEAKIGNKKFIETFTGIPVNIKLADNQQGAGACPILDLELQSITLNLLGLVVETSDICVTITAYEGGGLLGDLLCSVANLLQGGLSLNEILDGQGLPLLGLPGLTPNEINEILGAVRNLFNNALRQLLNAILTEILPGVDGTCEILHLELGPLNLVLLGLEVILDDCAGGPVTVDITGVEGQLLGDLLCGLLGGLDLGLTLNQILNLLVQALN